MTRAVVRGVNHNVGLSCEAVDRIHDRPEGVVREAGALQNNDIWIEKSYFVQDKLYLLRPVQEPLGALLLQGVFGPVRCPLVDVGKAR